TTAGSPAGTLSGAALALVAAGGAAPVGVAPDAVAAVASAAVAGAVVAGAATAGAAVAGAVPLVACWPDGCVWDGWPQAVRICAASVAPVMPAISFSACR